jgi:hypothetical protein
MSGITSHENSNIPLVKVNRIMDDLENLEFKHFGAGKTRPMTANSVLGKLIYFVHFSIEKKRTFGGVPPPS